jgi:hypothetical protein
MAARGAQTLYARSPIRSHVRRTGARDTKPTALWLKTQWDIWSAVLARVCGPHAQARQCGRAADFPGQLFGSLGRFDVVRRAGFRSPLSQRRPLAKRLVTPVAPDVHLVGHPLGVAFGVEGHWPEYGGHRTAFAQSVGDG